MEKIRIAVDAMGGDYAPGVVLEGVAAALYEYPDYEITLVGNLPKLGFYLEKYGIAGHSRLKLVHAESVVEMSDHSATALRAKKDSSITECARLMKSKAVDAMVSPGHTGASVAVTKVLNRSLPGIDRPGIAASLPCRDGRYILMDAGANPDCRPLNLVQFALMGEVYARYLLGRRKPTVGMLSVGGEDGKGNDLTRAAFQILEGMPINFIGNVEGNSIFEGGCDVVVCDGFSGNVLLKTSEGLAKLISFWLKRSVRKNPLRVTGALLAKNAFSELRQNGDPDVLGGAPLLGINGTCIIGHGSSSPLAVKNAIRVGAESVRFGVNDQIIQRLEECHAATEELEAVQTGA